MISLTRRELARVILPLLTPVAARGLPARAKVEMSLAQEFPRSTLKAITPDGKAFCLEDWGVRGYPLRVLEVDTWKQVYAGQFQSRTQTVGFFSDGMSLLVQALTSFGKGICGVGKGNCALQEAVVDLRTGARIEKVLPLDIDRGETYWALSPGVILDAHYETRPYWTTETVALMEFPSFREIAKAKFSPFPREPKHPKGGLERSEFGFGLSDDRSAVAYSFDHTLLCRGTSDLQVRWSRQVESGLSAFHVVLSARGDRVAAAIADSPIAYEQHVSYVAVFDGGTGADVARLPRSGTDGIALSPDGNLIAVVAREPGQNGAAVPTVHIYEVSSGREVASVAHDRIKNGRHQFLEAGCTVAFTSDGRYLVTSGMTTKLWNLG
jgi:hypothetical protein